ncbi:MAG: tetratricopeptide repeat protein [Vampirovibrionales bacterium]|nr:tetratricopeptide repeat protein [Vampirovibrionales bacterium]
MRFSSPSLCAIALCIAIFGILGVWNTPQSLAEQQTTIFPSPLKAELRWIDVKQNALRFEKKGVQAMAIEDYLTAIDAFQLGIRLNPDSKLSASLYHNLGLSFRAIKDYPRAIRAAQHAMMLHPDFEMYRFHLIRTYEAAGLLPQAQQEFEHLLAENPDNNEVTSLLQLTRERQEDLNRQ